MEIKYLIFWILALLIFFIPISVFLLIVLYFLVGKMTIFNNKNNKKI